MAELGELGFGMEGEEMAKGVVAEAERAAGVVVEEVPLARIRFEDQALRFDPCDDGLVELAASILAVGLLQPVGVVAQRDGSYQLLWGSRRCKAMLRLRRASIRARIYEELPASVKTVALVENVQREQMSLEEECSAVAHLHVAEDKSPDQIADICSKSRAWVMRRLALPGLPADLRQPCFEGSLSVGSAEALARVASPETRAMLVQQVRACNLNQRQVEEAVRALEESPSILDAIEAGVAAAGSGAVVQQVGIPCQACGVVRQRVELMMLLVCAGGCAARAPEPVPKVQRVRRSRRRVGTVPPSPSRVPAGERPLGDGSRFRAAVERVTGKVGAD